MAIHMRMLGLATTPGPRGGWSRPSGNGRGRWSRPRRGDLDPHPGRGDRAVTLPGPPARGRRRPGRVRRGARRAAGSGLASPGDPDSGEDTELGGRDTIAGRLSDEVSWLRQCADWLSHLDADSYPLAVNLRPSADWPDRAIVAADLARVAAVIYRLAADVDELPPAPP